MSIWDLAQHTFGIITRRQALEAGFSRGRFDALVDSGELVRLTRSHYALPGTPPEIRHAVQARGVLSCESALALHGGWTLRRGKTHLRRTATNRYRYPLPAGCVDCSHPSRLGSPSQRFVDDLPTALTTLVQTHDDESAVVAMDGVLAKRLMSRPALEQVVAPLGTRQLRLLNRVDGIVESPLESLFRFRLESLQIRIRFQVGIPGVGRVDAVIGNCIIVELDGFEFHSSPEQFANDRRRDRAALKLGYSTLRITWSDLLERWEQVLGEILHILRRRRHRRLVEVPDTWPIGHEAS